MALHCDLHHLNEEVDVGSREGLGGHLFLHLERDTRLGMRAFESLAAHRC
jgi:hypothetical protein